MNRSLVIFIGAVVAAAALSVAATVLILKTGDASKPAMSEEQRAAREKFFGSGKELPPIEKGQEMRPRW